MKTILYLFLLCLITFFKFDAFAQDAEKVTPLNKWTTYNSPETPSLTCPRISAKECFGEINSIKSLTGFEKIYFNGTAVAELLAKENCIGIRFYSALEEGQTTVSIIAASISSDGTENGEYLISNGIGVQANETSINRLTAQASVTNLHKNGAFRPYSAVFSKHEIEGLLNRKDASGIHVIPGSRKFVLDDSKIESCITMSLCSAKLSNGSSDDLDGPNEQYIKSLEPCPYVCGELSKYLVSPR